MGLPFDLPDIVLTALVAILATKLISPTLFDIIGLPPLPVLARHIRPLLHIALFVGLTSYRAVTILSLLKSAAYKEDDDDDHTELLSRVPLSIDLSYYGLLDALIQLMHDVRGNIVADLSSFSQNFISSKSLHTILSILGLLINDVLGIIFLRATLSALYSIRHISPSEIKDSAIQSAYEFASENISFVKKEIEKEENKMMESIEKSLKDPNRIITKRLPSEGRGTKQLIAELQKRAKAENSKWQEGLVSGTVYSGEAGHTDLLNAVYAAYSLSNPLHADIWPSVSQLEAEVVSMTAGLVNGGDDRVVGATTSGGTESIVLAMRSAKEYFGRRRNITRPEIIACSTAHAGLDKACEMFEIRLISLPADPVTFELPPADVEQAMTRNTILIYSSAPSFPQGVIDPITALSDLAVKYDVGLHVDGCLGGFVLPFAKKLGFELPPFDFGCPGVTSMSCDTHKYGYATKGTSVVLYRNRALRQAQYFTYPKWSGGLYATPTIAGSRSGALLACAWASLISLGESGFKSRVKRIMDTTLHIANEVASIDGLYLLGGKPKAMVVCFASKDFDIYRVGDALSKRGWSLNTLQRPASIHLCVTLQTVPHADKFITELKSVVGEIRLEGNDGKQEGNTAIYGLAGSLPPGPVASLLKCYTDATLTP